MNIVELLNIYRLKMNPLFVGHKQIEVLIFIWAVEPIRKMYEIIAAEKDPSSHIIHEPKLHHVHIDDLPLYVHYKFKTTTFENLLKGEPIVKPSTGLKDTREIIKYEEEKAYLAKINSAWRV